MLIALCVLSEPSQQLQEVSKTIIFLDFHMKGVK